MQILINTDHNIHGRAPMVAHVTGVLEHALHRFSSHITRVEAHLSDENGDKGGLHDKRCMIEARLRGRQPIAVTNEAETLDQAIHGATHKLIRQIDDLLKKRRDKPGDGPAVMPELPVA